MIPAWTIMSLFYSWLTYCYEILVDIMWRIDFQLSLSTKLIPLELLNIIMFPYVAYMIHTSAIISLLNLWWTCSYKILVDIIFHVLPCMIAAWTIMSLIEYWLTYSYKILVDIMWKIGFQLSLSIKLIPLEMLHIIIFHFPL